MKLREMYKKQFLCLLKLLYTFAGVLREKIYKCAVLNATITNYISVLRLWSAQSSKNGFALVFFYRKNRSSQNPEKATDVSERIYRVSNSTAQTKLLHSINHKATLETACASSWMNRPIPSWLLPLWQKECKNVTCILMKIISFSCETFCTVYGR